MSNYSVQIQALIDAGQLKKALEDAAGKLQLDLPSLKIEFKNADIDKLVSQLRGAQQAMSGTNEAAVNLGTKFTEVKDGADKTLKTIEQIKTGLYTAATTTKTFDENGKEAARTIATVSDGIKKQADETRVAQKAQQDFNKFLFEQAALEEKANELSDRYLIKKQEDFKKFLTEREQLEEKANELSDRYLMKKQELEDKYIQNALSNAKKQQEQADNLLNRYDTQKQKEYQKYLQQELELDRQIEQERTRQYDQYVKQQARYTEKIYDNANAYRNLEQVLSGLTEEQKKTINAKERLNKIHELGAAAANNDADATKRQGKEISALTTEAKSASRGMNSFAAQIEYTAKRFVEIGIALLVIRKIKQAISDMISNVTNLDSALVELKKVTNLTGDELETFTNRAFKLGEGIARTGTEVIEAAAIFARSGYDIKEALDLSETALILLNVGDGISGVEEAATSLISVLKGYNLEASKAMEVTDLINQISNTSAINFEDLTEGLTRTSAVFNQAGVSIQEASSLLTATNEVLQNIKVEIRYFNHGAYVQKCA